MSGGWAEVGTANHSVSSARCSFIFNHIRGIPLRHATHIILAFRSPRTEKKIGHIHSLFELEALDIDKNLVNFQQFKGKVTVVTNVASHCGESSSLVI